MQLNINGKSFEINSEELKKALESDAPSFEIKSDLVVRTSQEEETYTSNLRKEGTTIGAEIGRKELLKSLGIEGEGLHKSDEKALESINELISSKVSSELEGAKIEPNKKVAELNKDLEQMKNTLFEKESLIKNLSNDFSTYKKNQTISSKVSELIPENTVIPKKSIMKLMLDDIKLDVNENNMIYGIGEDGQPLKDEHLNLLSADKIVTSYFDSNPHYLKSATGGAGGSDSSGGSSKQSLEAFTKEMMDAGHSPNSSGFNQIMTERIKSGTLDL